MITKITWTFGNFDITVKLSADINGPAAEMLLRAAGLNILQRAPAGAAEKKLAGHEKRPAGFQRNSIAFSEDHANTLHECFTGEFNLNPDGEPKVMLTYACESVADHASASAKSDSKFVEERKVAARHSTDWPTFMADKIGFKGEVGTFDAPTTESLAAIRAYVKAMTAGI